MYVMNRIQNKMIQLTHKVQLSSLIHYQNKVSVKTSTFEDECAIKHMMYSCLEKEEEYMKQYIPKKKYISPTPKNYNYLNKEVLYIPCDNTSAYEDECAIKHVMYTYIDEEELLKKH